jgi:hypothetical protein
MAAVRLFPPHGQIWIQRPYPTFLPLLQPLERFLICFKHAKWLTLSSVSLMIQVIKTQIFQRRRENVHPQLALWPQEKSQQADIWQDLVSESKKAIIVALARLIAKAICPPNVTQAQELGHDR